MRLWTAATRWIGAALLATLLSGGVWLERSTLQLRLDGYAYDLRLTGRLSAPEELDLSDPAKARAWEEFVRRLPLQPGYVQADLRVGGRAAIEIRLKGTLTPEKPVLGLPFTQESESEANLLTLRRLEDGSVELRLNPAAAEAPERLSAEVRAWLRRGIPLELEGAEKPAARAEPYVWRIRSGEDPLRLRFKPPFEFFGVRP